MSESKEGAALARLIEFFKANSKSSRAAADKTDNQIGHGVHTGEAVAFEAAAGYCEIELMKLETE